MYNWTEPRISAEFNKKLEGVSGDTAPVLGGDIDLNSNAFVANLTAGESLANGDLCYYSADGKLWKASASSDNTCRGMLAIAMESVAADSVGKFCINGFYQAVGFAPADLLYVSTTSGGWQNYPPNASGSVVRIVGYGITNTEMFFAPDRTYLEIL